MPFRGFVSIIFILALSACTEEEIKLLGPTKCIAHRGVAFGIGQENTITAIEATYESGADGLEVDLVHTKDDIGMVTHDKVLGRDVVSKPGKTCPIGKKIETLKLVDIRENCLWEKGDEILTLEELFAFFDNRPFIILLDIKDIPTDHSIRLINDYYATHRGLLYTAVTFATNLEALYSLNQKIANPFLLAADRYVPGIENGFDGVEARKISDIQIRMLKEKAKLISMFDVNDLASMKHLREMKINFITTDRMDLCLQSK